ncbi:UDP-glycosyltransferase UGT5-like isoform X2 [Rhynchophorus ferrugineus]|uniref:UDP-glycosyltransferase UGT5-like isoform X2 n=1 Tax=Rhynchophorus ferrugineus TaxID=354439 RepID=UPI003FCE0334
MLACIFLVSFVLSSVQSAKILGVFMAASYSHQNMFRPIWNELALRGHQLTIYTTFPLKNESITNLIEYDFEFCIRLKENRSNFERPSRFGNLLEVIGVMRDTTEAQLQHPFMTDLIHNVRNESFDLILVEHYWQTYFALKDVYKVPMVGITSFPLTIPALDGLGLERHPCIEPDMLLKFSEPNTFIKRLISWSFNWAFRVFYDIYFRAMFDDQIRRYFGNTSRTSSELSREFSLVIGQSNIALVNSVTTSRNFIPVSSIHVKPEKPLPEDLASFLNKTKNDVIYFSLGTNVKMSKIAPEARKKIFNVLGSLPYTILWKYDKDIVPEDTPKNFYTRLWYPQQDVLAHPKVKLFITQGGLQSIDEALDRKVPMLIIPIFGDQPNNADRCVSKKIAEKIDIQTFTKEELRSKILQLIDGPIYREHIEKQFAIANDQPMSGLDTAIFWIEYVIRHKGAPHLRSPLLDLPFYQYYLLDIYSFLGVAIAVILAVIYFTMKFTLLTVCKLLNKSSAKQKLS